MADFLVKYQQWLQQVNETLQSAQQHQVEQLVMLVDTIKAYVKAGSDLTTDEAQLFLETFRRQAEEAERPSIWPEALWCELARVTDQTQVEWQELLQDLEHQGTYQQGEWVGMGLYCCQHCQNSVAYFHPAELLACSQCGASEFHRQGLPI